MLTIPANRATAAPTSTAPPGPAPFTLHLYRGDSYHWQFHLWTDAAKTQPLDLTGVVVAAQIRDRSGGSDLVDLVCTITPPNVIDIELSAADSQVAPTGGWDLQLTYTDGRVLTIVSGPVFVTGDFTR